MSKYRLGNDIDSIAITLRTGHTFNLVSDSVDIDDGVVYAEQVNGKMVGFPEAEVLFVVEI